MAQITPKKTSVVESLKDLLSQAKSVAVVDYRGLKVSQATQLRRDIKKAGGQIVIAKNTLFKIAAGNQDLNIGGTSAFVFSLTDEVSAIKAVADFAKKNALPTFKIGMLGSQVLTDVQIAQLATIPDKATLISKTLGSLKSPLYGLANALNWNISQLVRTLEAVRVSKGVTN